MWPSTSITLYSACELEMWEYRWKQISSCNWRCIFVRDTWKVDNLSAFAKWFPFWMLESCTIGLNTVSWLSASFRSCTIGCKCHIISGSHSSKWTHWHSWLIAKNWSTTFWQILGKLMSLLNSLRAGSNCLREKYRIWLKLTVLFASIRHYRNYQENRCGIW
jgi:hypothetical protein